MDCWPSQHPPPIIVDHNITTATFTFDDGADPSVWFSGTYGIALQADGGYGMAIALDDAPVTLNRPLLDGETLAVTIRRGVGRAGVRLVGETAAYTVWIETSGIAVLQRDGAEQGRVPIAGDAQRVALTYASGTLSASVGAYAFPLISDGTAFASLRAEFVVQGGNGQGSTFDEVNIAHGSEAGDWTFITFAEEDMVAASALYSPDNQFHYREFWETFNDDDPLDFYQSHITDSTSAGVMIGFTEGFISYPPLFTAPYVGAERTNDFSSEIRLSTEINLPARPGGHTITDVGVGLLAFRKSNSPFPSSSSDVTLDFFDVNGVLLHSSLYCRTNTIPGQCANPRPVIDVQHVQRIVVKWSQPAGSGVIYRMAFDNIRIMTDEVIFNPDYQGLLGNYWNGFSLLDTPAIEHRIDGNLTFSSSWDVAGLTSSDRFTVHWTGEIQLSLPSVTASEATPTTEPTSLRFCFRTTVIPDQVEHEGLRLWIDQEEIELTTGQVDPTDETRYEYCSSTPRQVVFNNGWLPIYIEYWRYAAVNAEPNDNVDLADPTFDMTWEDTNGQFERMVVPAAQLRAGDVPPPGPDGDETTQRPGALAHYATCPADSLQLVPVFTGQGQETLDMRAVANEDGIIIHDGPTWNAVQYGTIPWGTVIEVDRRMVFEQAGEIADQVWYRLAPGSPYHDSDNDRWIAVRMAGTVGSGATSSIHPFAYAVGMSASDSNTRLLCNDVADIEPEATITFTYDRQAAAEYAIAYAYRNSIPNIETTVNEVFPGNGRATRRTNVTTISGSDGEPITIPYLSTLRYADFYYNYIQHGVPGSTASAVFLSEALWMGGLPMTYNIDVAGEVDTNADCATTLVTPDPSNDLGVAGWRHCDEEIGDSTRVWRTHQGIICYYSQSHDFVCSTEQSLLNMNGVLLSMQHGVFLGSFALREPETLQFRQDLENITGNIPIDGFINLDTSDIAQTFYSTFIITIPNITRVEIGDYMFTDRNFSRGHGYMVAGWGPVTSCSTAYSRIWRFEAIPTGQETIYGQLTTYQTGLAPYVVDFPGSIDVRQTQRPRPRPFYCAPYFDLDDTISQDVNDDLSFYKILDDVSLVLSSEQMYASSSWNWSD